MRSRALTRMRRRPRRRCPRSRRPRTGRRSRSSPISWSTATVDRRAGAGPGQPLTTSPIVTLTTDFGLRDPFVAIMKGVILTICHEARLVDVTHDVAPHDIGEASLALESSVAFFPPGTVHLAVVD